MDHTARGQRTCFASRDMDEVLDLLRSQLSEIRAGKLCATISGGDGATVLVCLSEDQAQFAAQGPLHRMHLHATEEQK